MRADPGLSSRFAEAYKDGWLTISSEVGSCDRPAGRPVTHAAEEDK